MGIPVRGTGAEQLRETAGVPSEAAALRSATGPKPSAPNSGVSQVAAENANSMDLGTSAIDQVLSQSHKSAARLNCGGCSWVYGFWLACWCPAHILMPKTGFVGTPVRTSSVRPPPTAHSCMPKTYKDPFHCDVPVKKHHVRCSFQVQPHRWMMPLYQRLLL